MSVNCIVLSPAEFSLRLLPRVLRLLLAPAPPALLTLRRAPPVSTRIETVEKRIPNLLLLSLVVLLLLSLCPHLPARSPVTTVVARATRGLLPLRRHLEGRGLSLPLAVILCLSLCLHLPVCLLVILLPARAVSLLLALRSLAVLEPCHGRVCSF